jgi:hypothetical protein
MSPALLLADQAATGKEENCRDPTAGGPAFVVDVRLHLRMMRVYGCGRKIDRRVSLASDTIKH